MSDRPSWEQVAKEWARSEYLLRGKAHKHTVQVMATMPGEDGREQWINMMPTGDPCDYVTWRVRIEMLDHGQKEGEPVPQLVEAMALLRECNTLGLTGPDRVLNDRLAAFLARHGGQG